MIVDVLIDNVTPSVDVKVANRSGGISGEVFHNKTLVGNGNDQPLGVNTDIIATNARVDHVEETAENAKAIAEGKATGYVFDTVEDMNAWLETNSSILKLGDNLYIRAVNVPDYWWDGETVQQLETQKVDLTEYVKNTDYATQNTAGIVSVIAYQGINITADNHSLLIQRAVDDEIDAKTQLFKPIVPKHLDYAVKVGVTTNTIELSDDEKTAAQSWLGVTSNETKVVQIQSNTVELVNNTIFNAEEIAALTITFPTVDEQYVSQLNFTSGATATAFTCPDIIKWIGDDISDGAFVPLASKRYTVMFYFDGVNIRGAVQGVA